MISDVLSKAIQEIEEYQRTLPDTYDDLWDRIQNVKKVMTELREHLAAAYLTRSTANSAQDS